MKGNDRLARRLHSMTLTSLSLQMNWMLKGPEIRKALPQARHRKNNGRVKLVNVWKTPVEPKWNWSKKVCRCVCVCVYMYICRICTSIYAHLYGSITYMFIILIWRCTSMISYVHLRTLLSELLAVHVDGKPRFRWGWNSAKRETRVWRKIG